MKKKIKELEKELNKWENKAGYRRRIVKLIEYIISFSGVGQTRGGDYMEKDELFRNTLQQLFFFFNQCDSKRTLTPGRERKDFMKLLKFLIIHLDEEEKKWRKEKGIE